MVSGDYALQTKVELDPRISYAVAQRNPRRIEYDFAFENSISNIWSDEFKASSPTLQTSASSRFAEQTSLDAY